MRYGTDDWLSNQVQARPGSSAYGFSLDSEHPGWVKLSFLSRSLKAGGVVQTWASRSLPTSPCAMALTVPNTCPLSACQDHTDLLQAL